MATKYVGKSTTIEIVYNSSTTIAAQVLGITPPQEEFGEVESTILTDTIRNYMPTLLAGGTAGFRIALDPDDATHTSWYTAFQAGSTATFRIRLPSTINKDIVAFGGFITGWQPDEVVVDDLIRVAVSIRVNTAPSYSST